MRRVRWQMVAAYVVVIVPVMIGIAFFLQQPACLGDAACVRRTLILGTAVLMGVSLIISTLLANQIAVPILELKSVFNRIATGDTQARVLSDAHNEMGDLVRSFDVMADTLREQIGLLTEENDQFSTVLEKMADGVLITDDSSYVNFINPAAIRLLQTTAETAIGRSFAEVVRHYQLIDLWQRCHRENKEQVGAVEIGRELFLQVFVTPFIEAGSRAYLIILQDLTTMRHLQTVRRDFISNISHELRTPLASLRAVVETLQDGAVEDRQLAYRFLSRAERETDTLTQMVEELLELSRIESGQVPLRLQPTSVADLVLVPIERLQSQAKRADVNLVVDIARNLPPVLGDADRLHQVLVNLLHNAIKFTSEGGEVCIQAKRNPASAEGFPELLISVKDNGVGIPAEDLPRIFERFYKSDRARTSGSSGTGLGLAIARHLVQAHNGRIWAVSREGRGSTFFFTLPLS